MNRIGERFHSEQGLRRLLVCAAAVLTLVVVLVDVLTCRHYRREQIRTEQEQLLTIARAVGNGLDTWLQEEISGAQLYFSEEKTDAGGEEDAEQLTGRVEAFLQSSGKLYTGAAVLGEDHELLYRTVSGEGTLNLDYLRRLPLPDTAAQGQMQVVGRAIGESGWYELYLARPVSWKGERAFLVLVMDLNEIYQKTVRPVKIGEGGYSVVKDGDLAIIMHHVRSQIGMDAVRDREKEYPELDLSSLETWLEQQKKHREGTAVIDTYVWSDDPPTPVRRIVAFSSIRVQSERWIINSTLPMEELTGPFYGMIARVAAISVLFLLLMVGGAFLLARSLLRARAQEREIRYLKEINEGMELVARKNDEIRHYQRVQSLGMMSSHIAHEFNNYLTPAMVYADLLAADESLSEENRQLLGEMSSAMDRAASLSRELLAFARQDAGSRLHVLDLSREVSAACRVIRQLTPAKIQYCEEVTAEPLPVLLRDGMVQQILMNLCKNAYNAMEKSERRVLTISLCRDTDGAHAVLTVRDTGCGISEEAMQRIFEPFYTTKGSRQGTGLGLAVISNLMEAAKGSVRVESRVNEGTAFFLTFPLAGEADGREHLTAIRRIALVLSDAQSERELRRSAGTQKKYSFTFYEHPAALLSRVQSDPGAFDLLIADYVLPSMTGVDLLEMVRRSSPRIRLVLVVERRNPDLDWYVNNQCIDRIVLREELCRELGELMK